MNAYILETLASQRAATMAELAVASGRTVGEPTPRRIRLPRVGWGFPVRARRAAG